MLVLDSARSFAECDCDQVGVLLDGWKPGGMVRGGWLAVT